MIKGVFIALGIMLVCLLIPLVHVVAAPASPFIGGYIGISSAKANRRPPVAKAVTFGFLLGGLILMISVPAAAVTTVAADLGRFMWVLWGGVALLVIYTSSMSALGAMYSLLRAANENLASGAETETV